MLMAQGVASTESKSPSLRVKRMIKISRYHVGTCFLFFVSLAFTQSLAAASISPGSGSGAPGYSCSTTESPGDHIPGRSCRCTGPKDSEDCKKMRAEVCADKFEVCRGKTGGPIESCECKWKKSVRPDSRANRFRQGESQVNGNVVAPKSSPKKPAVQRYQLFNNKSQALKGTR